MKLNVKHTIYGCYMGYITQAVVNNLPPLLFLTFTGSSVFHWKNQSVISVNFVFRF